ncbi:MAG: hypothetical protein H8E59_00060, partial [Actinobacteria bacterium]|nr:hypothetical protein [Actinomycetota bacterium]
VASLRADREAPDAGDGAAHAEVEAAALADVDAAFDKARSPPMESDAMLDHCYSQDTQRLARQRAGLLAGPGNQGTGGRFS